MKAVPWLTLPVLAVLTAAPARAQNTAPAPEKKTAKSSSNSAKPPVHKPEQSALNQVQQDARAKKALQESADILRESIRKEQAATKEAKRLNKDQVKADPEKALQDIKDKLSPEDTAALKEQLKKTAKTVLDNDETKKMIEEVKKKGAAAVDEAKKSKPSTAPAQPSAPLPPPTTFDKIPGPTPVAPVLLPAPPRRTVTTVVNGDKIVLPPTTDPNHPGQPLKPADPLGRTYVIMGNAQIKMPTMQVDADQIVCLQEVSGAGQGLLGMGGNNTAAAPRPNDPVKPAGTAGSGKKSDANGLENMVATGRVRVVRLDNGKEYHAKGNRMVHDQKTGATTITGWPTLQESNRLTTGNEENSVIVLYSNGKKPYLDRCTFKMLSDPKTAQSPGNPAPASRDGTATATADSPPPAAVSTAPAVTAERPAVPGATRRSAAPSSR
ncbi:MAG: hypothetical protein V4726_14705 [Verrucomicrobiota bacterium]